MDAKAQSGPASSRPPDKRSVDMQIISDWVEPGSRVLDLGCGRGVLLEYLIRKKGVFGVGVDVDADKISSCLGRGVTAYHGDMHAFMRRFPDRFFDRIICSRTLQELTHPAETVLEALRLARFVTVGYVNHAFWKNRLSYLLKGHRVRNEVFPGKWHQARATHPVSIREFEEFCRDNRVGIARRVFLAGDWKSPCRLWPEWRAGYAVFDLTLDPEIRGM